MKAHVKARVENANANADKLHLAGARWNNFPAYVNIQCYAAFIRPGLEYGLQLIPPGHSCLSLLHQCQKKILCTFLGIKCEKRCCRSNFELSHRQTMLTHRRTSRVLTAWTSETSNDLALLFVNRGISGDTLVTPVDFDPRINSLHLRTLLYVIPLSDSLNRRFGGHLPISTLR